MFHSQIIELLGNVKRVRGYRTPPANVSILQAHADYLSVPYEIEKNPAIAATHFSVPHNARRRSLTLVTVRLVDLYQQLRSAKGVDYEEWEKESPDRGRIAQFAVNDWRNSKAKKQA